MVDPFLKEVAKQAEVFGVATDAVLGKGRSRAACAARRAVWAALLTHHAGGEFPAKVLAQLFDRQPSIIRAGAEMHRKKLLRWPRRMKDGTMSGLQLRLASLKRRYAKLDRRDPQRAAVRKECARIAALLEQERVA